ncbi:exodeoxyribonuclease III [Lactobacillus sp. PV037]|uniref:exodeoxyribonuclease III n=1 Tax=unclassified Lactobacillus TaxID=2620435 RepID=UPI00223FC6E8|nr:MULTISPECIES: exodeoxyribonuclease III [unclassified Lactobacillus]QNQ82714.1 exodeoxyribonuclease III [Lactobacillus sp. PV012]QNQ83167.1 exodeoxyribonuclease III [Lactobacillus sp. PV037]
MKIISWNIDSLNAALTSESSRAQETRNLLLKIRHEAPDVIAFQETKLRASGPTATHLSKLNEFFPDYRVIWRSSDEPARKSYAGTMFLIKENYHPAVEYPVIFAPVPMDFEGRILTLEFEGFYITQVYTPNSGNNLLRLEDREVWDKKYCEYLKNLKKKKPVIVCGDFNVAASSLDLKHPERMEKKAGYTPEERAGFSEILKAGFIDVYRYLNPDGKDYTWWDQRVPTSKQYNLGWRIDYFLVSDDLKKEIKDLKIFSDTPRKDHAPILLEIDLKK